MENPILEFRKSKGWSRMEFLMRSGISVYVLRDLEKGVTKRIGTATLECLALVGIGPEIQQRLDEWHSTQQEIRKRRAIAANYISADEVKNETDDRAEDIMERQLRLPFPPLTPPELPPQQQAKM